MPIEVKNVAFSYNRNPSKRDADIGLKENAVLKDMTFTCRDNRVTGIVGPNGCGKTTILKVMLYIMMPPDSLTISRKALPQAEYSDTNIDPGSMMLVDEKFMKNFESHRNLLRIREILRNPMKYYVSDYQYGLVFGVILACIVVLLYFNGTLASLIPAYTFEAFISLLVIMFMLPIAFAYEARSHYLKKFESQLPAFLREISDMKDMGMTLQSAIHIIANSKIGVLNYAKPNSTVQ